MKTINDNICGDGYDADERAKFIFNKCQNRIDSAYDKGYQQGRADAYIECMRIVSECVWKDSEMLEKMLAEQLKEQTNDKSI